MRLKDILIPSGVARPGMQVREAFAECIAHRLPGIPYCDENGEITGRISVKHVLASHYLPRDVWLHAHLLEDRQEDMNISPDRLRQLLDRPVDDLVLPDLVTLSPDASPIKALAMIERFNTSYLFVVDQGRYLGTVTLLGLVEQALTEIR